MISKNTLLPFLLSFFSVNFLFAVPANTQNNFLSERENDRQFLTIDRNFSTYDLLLVQQIEDNRKRVALVIGNAKYQHSTPLKNPVNDANDMAKKLREFGFEVILATDTDLKEMDRAVERFYDRLTEDSVALFFYAGHAIQVDGENYLIPIDADLKSASDAKYYTLPTNRVRDKMYEANSEVRIAILDACRDNPFTRNWRSLNGGSSRGLASIQNQGAGDFVAYATAPGMVASDGLSTQRNGVFTSYLLKHINPDRSIEDIFKLVRHDVARQTNNEQVPFTSNGLIGNFYFAKVSNSNSGIDNSNNQPKIEDNNIPQIPENNDRDVEYYRTRAVTYFQQTLYDEAIADYTQVIELNPQYKNVYYDRGVAYSRKRQYDRAIADYTQAIKLNPQYANAYYNRGVAYDNRKEYNKAIADYTQAIKLNPRYANAYYNRGLVYGDRKEYNKAIADYTQVIKLNSKNENAYHNRGVAYRQKREYDRAIADYTQVIKLNPQNEDAYYNRGIAYYEKEEYDRAIADYTQAIKLNPQNEDAYYNRGLVYHQKREYEKALRDYSKVVELNPNSQTAIDVKKKLEQFLRNK